MNRLGSISKISKAFLDLEQKFQRELSQEELAEVLKITAEEVGDIFCVSGRHASIDEPFLNGEENGLLDVLEDDTDRKIRKSSLSSSLKFYLG